MNLRYGAGAAAVTAVVLAAGIPAVAVPPPPAPLRWVACPAELNPHPRQRCADLAVPLDYRAPRGRQITVRISRIPAADPARRLGTLVHGIGGPGLGSLEWPTDMYDDDKPPQLRNRYDLVGFDPRGVRYSSPISCGPFPDPLIRYPRPDGSIDHTVAYARDIADACRHAGQIAPYITTANTARDLDRIRAAIGVPRISYWGLSYGTYLGAVYATLYPQRTDRFLLDSAIDPHRVWYDFVRLGGQGVAQRLPDLTAWIAARHDTYGLGPTAEDVHQRYRAIVTALDTSPVTIDGVTYDGNWLRHFTLAHLKMRQDEGFATVAAYWHYFATAAQPATTARSARPTALTTHGARPLSAQTPTDNRDAVAQAVQCGDATWPRDVRFYARAVHVDRLRYPDDAGRSANVTPCAFWPTPTAPPVSVTDRGPRNILVLHNRRDPSTPLTSGIGMRTALGKRAALVIADSGGHEVIGTNACATALALQYLTADHMRLPTDQTCPAT